MKIYKFVNTPLIKWTGSKRSQAKEIIKFFPKNIDTFYECFCGSCAVTFELLKEIYLGNIKCKHIICSDINSDLISLYNNFLFNNDELFNYYENLFNNLISYNSIQDKQKFYNDIRDKFNVLDNCKERSYLFFWLLRTCFNGLIRYNSKGEFNTSYHLTRNGIKPDKLKKIFDSYKLLLDNFINNGGTIQFINNSYDNVLINCTSQDLIYMDPPYNNTKGMYYANNFDINNLCLLYNKLTDNNVKIILSYDGMRGVYDKTVDLNCNYKQHLFNYSGYSSFSKLLNKDVIVKESLYLNYLI